MNKNKHIFKKKYGQNFLNDINLLKMIVKAADIENKNVVEIGPGKGVLTRLILNKAKKILAYEIDQDLKFFLNFENNPKINIIYDNFLSRNLEADFEKYFPKEEIVLIGNLPYYITTPLLFKILFLPQIKTFTIMIQKEVGLRILSNEKNKNYNALSVFIKSLTRVTKIKIIKKNMFFPQPKVDGIVLKFDKFELDEKDKIFLEKMFYPFIKAAFKQKRKFLINNLSQNFHICKKEISMFFQKNNISLNIRAEEIDIDKFKEITSLFFYFFNLNKINIINKEKTN
ncbi:16S rRNA (adenine(1518)-N(6)/adenine(1519)-N(6))-dimethyltransferase RsmA [Columbia Basin potato purple top phytoplasma]|uniref:Ribosomal RNA small subunit methyltransferase A n=1 Tax=Columbia Basin potato purple top phytoplasma TaxID=307134 RepID=A0ABT5L7Y3_9MOLU|nr:16S rRNA (adenine(1518)-N(6)/adenine(1519)-N(6))-dimethyltransferase RsmA [Columbia Basin potato purple top phytoplasma]MDC9031800.1 16S rRNA (adenine(1518)-N(6)/adenine(1519)-N(6))-dimethyltransferase RsmA [Columbia Basin potato purple top phytoplasma]